MLFDRVGATKGHGFTAWVVSLTGLVVSATFALILATGMLWLAGRYGQQEQTSAFRFAAIAVSAGTVLLLLISLATGALSN